MTNIVNQIETKELQNDMEIIAEIISTTSIIIPPIPKARLIIFVPSIIFFPLNYNITTIILLLNYLLK